MHSSGRFAGRMQSGTAGGLAQVRQCEIAMKLSGIPRFACFASLFLCGIAQSATFSVVNQDSAGTGFNDSTVFTPIGGNNATTLGAARLNVLNEAARIWGLRLTSTQTIVLEAKFAALTCTSTSSTLASAGPMYFFTTSAQPNVLLPAALADAITNTNNNSRDDISVSINSNVGTGASCLGGKNFYLGLDHNNGGNVDLLNVLLHELGHGLGFISLTNSDGTAVVTGKFSAFDQFVYSETLGKFWPAMTDAERAAASIASGAVTFNSISINNNLSAYTANSGLSTPGGHLRLYTPSTYSSGSSVSHWDTVASPDLLMEPFITANALGSTDLTGCVLRDIGWTNARCPDTGTNNTPPVAQSQTVNLQEDSSVQITLLGIDADSTGPLTYSIVTGPSIGTLGAPTSLSSSSGVVFTYTPNSNANGADSFTFQVNDGINSSNVATVSLNIAAVNDAPVANSQTVSTTSGTAVNITLSGTDVEGSTLTYAMVTTPTNGALSGTAPNLIYTPNASFTGADSFTFQVNDGGLNSPAATITIQVNPASSAATNSSSSGSKGGGALSWLLLLSLFSLHVTRWWVSKPSTCIHH